jgi:excisionase family DNA binding protein
MGSAVGVSGSPTLVATRVDLQAKKEASIVNLDDRESVVADGLMTVAECAAFLRLGRSTIYNLMDSGSLSYVRLSGREGRRAARRIPRKAVIALAAAHLNGGNVNTNSRPR